MNAFLQKEIRLLLPSFLIGCALTFSSWLLPWGSPDAISSILFLLPFIVCPAAAVMMTLDSFGVEVSSGTFTNLLAQPVSRLKIWETKISLLAVALLVVGVLWFGSIFCVRYFFSNFADDFKDLGELFVCGAMFALVVFSGGLWTVLLLRQVAAAFWFTLLVPGVIMVILVGLLADHSGEFIEGMAVSVLGLYSLAGFFFARWLFLGAQDVQWSGGTITMPEMSGLPVWLSRSAALRGFRPRAALWRKEFQLHQSQFIMAFALLLLHLGVIATRHFYDLKKSPDLKFILEIFWGLWLVMPVLVGCAAVAEERKLGTLEGQLCLPAKRRTQFATKFFVALFLSVLLGAVMPLLLEGTRILPKLHFAFGHLQPGWQSQMSTAQFFFWNCLGLLNGALPLLALMGIAAAFGVISFYVSSLARNTLQTLAPAVLGILLGFFGLMVIVQMQEFGLEFLWRGPLAFFTGAPVLLLALLLLAFWNFQHVRPGWKMWRQNLFAFMLALAFAVTATSAIYHRAWEKLTPFEPPHGAAKLSQSNTATLNAQSGDISVRLPDGKIWLANFIPGPNAYNPLTLLLGNIKIALDDGTFVNGSNWLTVKRSVWDLVGIKTDGSLWVSEKPWPRRLQNGKWNYDQNAMRHLVQFGSETNWSSFVTRGYSALLVKKDGTLWRWGMTNFNSKRSQWPGLRAFTPQRLGTNSDWEEIFQNYRNSYQVFLRKTDGSLWMSSENWNTNGQTLLEIEPDFIVRSVKDLGREKFRSVAEISHGLEFMAGVRDDGTFRIWADERLDKTNNKGVHYGNYEWFPTDLQIGDGTNWVAVAGGGGKIVTLKNDGSLWLWDFHRSHPWEEPGDQYRFEPEIQNTRPIRLGTHSDWITISGDWGNVTALAADGSLWFWPLENVNYMGEFSGSPFFDNGDAHIEPLLDISRKPQFLGNIFSRPD